MSHIPIPQSKFDVAIIGAGSAGCALAGRLAARSSIRVALIEAGPDIGVRVAKWLG